MLDSISVKREDKYSTVMMKAVCQLRFYEILKVVTFKTLELNPSPFNPISFRVHGGENNVKLLSFFSLPI